MPKQEWQRNRQVVRQWQILRALGSRSDVTIARLSEDLGVTSRTVRRDLDALQEAGFPLVDEVISEAGQKRWRLLSRLDWAA